MRIKAMFFDLDNTLLRDDKTISPYTLAVLGRCKEAGIRLAFSTARSLRTAALVKGDVPWDGGVYFSGGLAFDGAQLIGRRAIPRGAALGFISHILARWPGAQVAAEVDDCFFANHDAPDIITAGKLIKCDFASLPNDPEMLIIGTWPWAGPALPDELRSQLHTLLPEGLELRWERNGLGSVCPAGPGKLGGVRELCDAWGIPLLYAAAFGDDMSDVSMLGGVGHGIAVDNAIPQVKAAADYICGSNEDDGVARWIEENVL